MKRNVVLAAIVATVVRVSSGTAYASPITLLLETGAVGGSGADVNINGIDLLPGNALAVGGIGAPAGTPFQLYFQASLDAFTLNNLAVFKPSDSPNTGEITAVAGFREVATGLFPIASSVSFVPGGNNFFELWHDPANNADDLAGTGFSGGTKILGGTVVSAMGSFTAALDTNRNPVIVPFDSTSNNDYPGVTSVEGSGSTRVAILVNFLEPTVFTSTVPSLSQGLVLFLDFNTTNSTPFSSVDPSALFFNSAVSFAANRGAMNGISGPDFQFEMDANGEFDVLGSTVPEPTTLTLFVLGLVGSSMARRRMKKQK